MKKPRSIYVIDDDKCARDSLELLLTSAGHDVVIFSDGETFLQRSATLTSGIAILDLRMPGVCGLDVLMRLPPHIRAFLHSGNLSAHEKIRAMDNGAIGILEKPCPPSRLLAEIKDASSAWESSSAFSMHRLTASVLIA